MALREYGGVHGLKDEGLLHGALGRPVNKLAYAEPGSLDLFDLAAAYAYGLASNHAFNDANKRTAWACRMLFPELNGVEPDCPRPLWSSACRSSLRVGWTKRAVRRGCGTVAGPKLGTPARSC